MTSFSILRASCMTSDCHRSPRETLASRSTARTARLNFLSGHGLETPKVDAVWEAIALHNTAVIPERMGALTSLTYQGVAIDFGGVLGLPETHLKAVTAQIGAVIHSAYPRFNMATSVIDAVADHAASDPNNAPATALRARSCASDANSAPPMASSSSRTVVRGGATETVRRPSNRDSVTAGLPKWIRNDNERMHPHV